MRTLAVFGLSLAASVAGAITADRITDPRPRSAVVDTTGTLGAADVGTIDGDAGRARLGGELLVVVVDSVGSVVPRTFTTQLFNRWTLDGRQRKRGVMLLVAMKDRKAEIVVGDGFGPNVTTVTDRIMSRVVALFKAGRPRDAIVEGARALVDDLILTNADQPQAQGLMRPTTARPAPAPAAPQGFVERVVEGAVENPLPVAGGLGGVAAAGGLLRRYLRNRPRNCRACGTPMARLDEAVDDQHLTSGEKVEERVGSVDYDIWACRCGQTMKLRYGSLFSSYGKCRGCQAKTLKATTTTIVSATTSSEGRARVDERCAHCGYSRTYERSIPRVQERSSSSSSRGGTSSGRGSSGSW